MQNIGQHLKELREKSGYSQQKLSQLLGFAKNSYGSYERNNSTPPIEKFIKLAELYHTSVQYIVTGEAISETFDEKAVTPFPERLQELRMKSGRKQVELADALHVAEVTYQRYEYGHFEPKLDKLLTLADLFGVSLDELFGRNQT